MFKLPDTNNRINDLVYEGLTLWNETGYECVCGNILIVGCKKKLFCYKCDRYWVRKDLEKVEN